MSVETFETPSGRFSVDIDLDRKMAASLSEGEPHQADTLNALRPFFKEGALVVDAGAHIGTFSIPLARSGMRVIAFEPNVQAFELLKRNSTLNGVSIDARLKGLGEASMHARLDAGDAGNAGSRSLMPGEGGIEVVRLDDEVAGIDLLKMDIEGMELAALKGAGQLIEDSRPLVLFEVNLKAMQSHGATLSAIRRFFKVNRYHLFLLDEHGVGAISSLWLAVLCITPGTILFGRPSYPFDVLAIPKEKPIPAPFASAFTTHLRLLNKKMRQLIAG